MLDSSEDVESFFFDEKNEVLESMKLAKNLYVINHTSSCPHLAKKIYDELNSIDCYAIDAPI